MSDKCRWVKYENDGDIIYASGCFHDYGGFEGDSPKNCDYNYCPNCGKQIEEVKE